MKGVPKVLEAPPKAGQKIGSWELGAVEASYDEAHGTYSVAVHLLLGQRPGDPPIPPEEHPAYFQRPGREGQQIVGSLYFRVTIGDQRQVLSMCLTDPDGFVFDGETLRRFAWSRWLTVADAAVRELQQPESRELASYFGPNVDVKKVAKTQRKRQLQQVTKSPRPGRRGHPDTFYIEVAERYRELRLQGSTRPTKDLAEESSVNRNTAAGWIRSARQRGFLATAPRGRPG